MHKAGVMSVSDQDLELLENYLDDEVIGADLDGLRKRLASDQELTLAMSELRVNRQMRQQFFTSCEPSQKSIDSLIRGVRQGTTRQRVLAGRSGVLRRAGSLAACLLFGFLAGHGWRIAPGVAPTGAVSPMVRGPGGTERITTNDGARGPMKFDGPLANKNNSNGFTLSGTNLANVAVRDPLAGYQINIVDRNGNIVRRFDSNDQYMKFVSDQADTANPPAMAP